MSLQAPNSTLYGVSSQHLEIRNQGGFSTADSKPASCRPCIVCEPKTRKRWRLVRAASSARYSVPSGQRMRRPSAARPPLSTCWGDATSAVAVWEGEATLIQRGAACSQRTASECSWPPYTSSSASAHSARGALGSSPAASRPDSLWHTHPRCHGGSWKQVASEVLGWQSRPQCRWTRRQAHGPALQATPHQTTPPSAL